jgi:hypothetical protein
MFMGFADVAEAPVPGNGGAAAPPRGGPTGGGLLGLFGAAPGGAATKPASEAR